VQHQFRGQILLRSHPAEKGMLSPAVAVELDRASAPRRAAYSA